MPTTYGLIQLPVQSPATPEEAAGDPALTVVAEYLRAVINAYATTAWRTVAPADPPIDGRDFPVNSAFTHDPEDEAFSENALPAIYLFRSSGTGARAVEDAAEDYRLERSTWVFWWVYRPTTQSKSKKRAPFVNAVAKIIDEALDRGRDAAFVRAGDTDPLSASHEPATDSIKLAVATATTPQTYSGAALDGAIGGATMNPPRSPTVTASGPAGAFAPGSRITWRGVNALGLEVEVSVDLAGPGIYDARYDFKRIDAIDVDPQASADGAFEFGTAARAGIGTDIFVAAGLHDIRAGRWSAKTITIYVKRGEPKSYDALEVLLEAAERRVYPLEDFDLLDDGAAPEGNAGAEVTLVREDGSTIDTAIYDD